MSWIVQSLLNSQLDIKEKGDIESSEFNDLLLIEKAISELQNKKLISSEEIAILEYFKNNKPESDKPRGERHFLSRRYYEICDRIAYYLGGYYTDEGYLEYMKTKYCLSDTKVEILRKYMRSRNKNKVMRKPIHV